jgi:hypothetical protein
MTISEQNKQEAERISTIYENAIFDTYDSIHCAIQDRQSVLEALSIYDPYYVGDEIKNLTEQINYLKSKL